MKVSNVFKDKFEETFGHKIQRGNLRFVVEENYAVN